MTRSRLFRLHWDNAIQQRSTKSRRVRFQQGVYEGTHYANGYITLDNGSAFESMFEMEEHFKQIGQMKIEYQD